MSYRTDGKYERGTYSKRFTNFKKIYFNHTREIECFNCGIDLKESYVVSANRHRIRCLDCANKYNIIPEIPKECEII